MGRYFTEEEAYKAAVICYVLSLQFEADHDKVEPELVYIQNKMGEEFEPPTVDLVEKYSKEYDFPTWASDDVINIAVGYAKHTLEKNDYETARYFLNIAYELTQSEEVKLKLAEIKDLK